MNERGGPEARNGSAQHRCRDGVLVVYSVAAFRGSTIQTKYRDPRRQGRFIAETVRKADVLMPRNGPWVTRCGCVLVVGEVQMSRAMTEITKGSLAKTCVFPRTVGAVCACAFMNARTLRSVRFDAGLALLDDWSFADTGLVRLVLTPGVRSLGYAAFACCGALRRADLGAVQRLECVKEKAFAGCGALREVLFAQCIAGIGRDCFLQTALERLCAPGVQVIGKHAFGQCALLREVEAPVLEVVQEGAFEGCGLEAFVAPASLQQIGPRVFAECLRLAEVDLGACSLALGQARFVAAGAFCDRLERIVLPRTLRAVEDGMFAGLRRLRSVEFGADSWLERIGARAFYGCGLESFAAPRSLWKIGSFAFGACRALRDVRLGAVQELGLFCLWNTAVTRLTLPRGTRLTPAQLGVGQSTPGLLRIPDGVEVVARKQFQDVGVRRVVVSSGVRVLGEAAFACCAGLRQVVFEGRPRLERIEAYCFAYSGLEGFAVPRGVRFVGDFAFVDCPRLVRLRFEEGSQLAEVGDAVFAGTPVEESASYPNGLK